MLYGCSIQPKNFSYFYTKENTGLDKLINLDGYYVCEHGCDSTFYSIFMFYPDGLFTIATTSRLFSELTESFEKGGNDKISKYPLWGSYVIEKDIIRTQVVKMEGNGCTIFRDYRILPDKQIVNISDYVQPQFTNLAYMKNYPSFAENKCPKIAKFYPTTTKRNKEDCSLLKLKWFDRNK